MAGIKIVNSSNGSIGKITNRSTTSVAIDLEDVSNLTIGGGYLADADIGVRGRNLKNVTFGPMLFENTGQAWSIDHSDKVKIEDSSVTRDPKVKDRRLNGASQVGWRARAKGPALPSHCPDCDTVFPSANYDLHGRMYFVWNSKDVCLECGSERAYVSEGLFNLINETVEVLKGPEITQRMVRRLRQLSKSVDSGRINPGTAVLMAATIHPELGRIAEKYWNGTTKKGAMFTAVVATLLTYGDAAEKLGWIEEDSVKTSDIERMLRGHDELWQKRHHQSQERILTQGIENQRKQTSPSEEAEDNPIAEGSRIGVKHDERYGQGRNQKTSRLKLIEHKRTFGGARTR